MGGITGVVFGAGRSRRFDSPKQLFPFEETTLSARPQVTPALLRWTTGSWCSTEPPRSYAGGWTSDVCEPWTTPPTAPAAPPRSSPASTPPGRGARPSLCSWGSAGVGPAFMDGAFEDWWKTFP